MFNEISLVVLLLALSPSCFSQVIRSGKCPEIKYLTDFNLAAYTGVWYEYAKYPFTFEFGQKCISAEYTALEGNKVGVKNTALYKITNLPTSIEGHADVLGPGRLAVIFGITNSRSPQENYVVLGTDYTSWAFVYSCSELLFFKTEFAWILTRERQPTDEQIASAKQVMAENGISQSFLVNTKQENCQEATN